MYANPTRRLRRHLLALGVILLGAACSDQTQEREPDQGEQGDAISAAGVTVGQTYQRTVLFMDTSRDTSMFVPWEFTAYSDTLVVRRTIRGWLGRTWNTPDVGEGVRDGQWELFIDDEWRSPLTRSPWRIHPRGPARLIMGPDDALQEIYYRAGFRDLSIRLRSVVAEWSGARRANYRILRGTAQLPGYEAQGLVLDVSMSWPDGTPEPSEWALLSGPDTFVFLAADGEVPGPYRAWTRQGAEEQSWSEVNVAWEASVSFEAARREVPVLWQIDSRDGELSGTLESKSSDWKTLGGNGAIRPVLVVFEVAGELLIGGVPTPVRGFLRHYQR